MIYHDKVGKRLKRRKNNTFSATKGGFHGFRLVSIFHAVFSNCFGGLFCGLITDRKV